MAALPWGSEHAPPPPWPLSLCYVREAPVHLWEHLNFFQTKGVQLTQQKEPWTEGEAAWLASHLIADPSDLGLSFLISGLFPHVEHGLSKSNKWEVSGGTDHVRVGFSRGRRQL